MRLVLVVRDFWMTLYKLTHDLATSSVSDLWGPVGRCRFPKEWRRPGGRRTNKQVPVNERRRLTCDNDGNRDGHPLAPTPGILHRTEHRRGTNEPEVRRTVIVGPAADTCASSLRIRHE